MAELNGLPNDEMNRFNLYKLKLSGTSEIYLASRSFIKCGAQYYPRPACPLNRALLMQVHDQPQGVPVLALAGDSVSVKRMQSHAAYACLFTEKMAGYSGIFERTTARPVLRGGGCNPGSVQV